VGAGVGGRHTRAEGDVVSALSGWRRRLSEILRSGRADRDTVDELRHHVELLVEEKVRAGLSEAEARRAARLELGNPEAARERVRDGRAWSWLESLRLDAGYALRALRARRAYSAACVASIAIGVGASTALFAVVDAVLLKPLPLPAPDRLVRIYDTNPAAGMDRRGVASGNLSDWRREARTFDGIAGDFVMGRTLTLGDQSEVVLAAQVTADFFPLLGVPAALGRVFTEEEVARGRFDTAASPIGGDPVAVLGHGLWMRRFGGDPQAVGRTLTIEKRAFRVVGVMPEGFAMPEAGVQVFLPWGLDGREPRDQHYLHGLARLAPGVTVAEAESDLRRVARDLAAAYPSTNEGWSVRVVPLQEDVVGATGRPLLLMLAAVFLVLVAACANVSLMTLARGLEDVRDGAVRRALGATRSRLLRQFLTESALCCAAGGLLGAQGAVYAVRLLASVDAGVPRLAEAAVDARVLLFALAASAFAALLSGLPAAWRRAAADPVHGLAPGTRVSTGTGRATLRDVLVVAEVALAVLLLAAAGLLLRSYERLRAVDPGFDPRGVLVAPIFLDMGTYGQDGRSRVYYQELVSRLEALPGVVSAGGATALPGSPLGPNFERPVWPEERPDDERVRRMAWVRMVTPRYFETLRLPVVEGRGFDAGDHQDAPRRVVLSRGLARSLWPSGTAVGRRLSIDYSSAGTYPYEVVGVVDDVRFGGPREEPRPELYLAHAQRPYLVMNVAVRTEGDPRALAPAVREVLRGLDPGKPAHGLHPLDDLMAATYARDRHALLVLGAFAAIAVLLSLVGIHGLLLCRVRERTREVGIRMALGARRGRVLGLFALQGLRLVAAGVVIGGALALWTARLWTGLLFAVGPADPAPLVAAAGLALVGLAVALHPAWRATRVDAAEVLRAD
jgi:putative ABC transport system permease protein